VSTITTTRKYKELALHNLHTFERMVASTLHHAGLVFIMKLGGWESLDIVLRYTRSVKFEDSLRLYRTPETG